MLKSLWLTLLLSFLLIGCTSGSPTVTTPVEVQALLNTITQRLNIANDVALSKFYSGKPVQDSERERQVIANAESQAATYRLDTGDVRAFMTAQIEANKVVQYGRIAQWRETGRAPAQPAASQMAGIRTQLDALQPQMMKNLAAFVPRRNDSACSSWLLAEIQRQTTDPVMLKALEQATDGLCKAQPKT
ncbi:chorismate mutase [Pseudomonas sp. SLFW]|uniref:chorismate mutase n=1 Tax=Pseudomonas sp. SLFW TaxID=2683259 RepID=UPI001411EC9D|nr:chorismate mutase [Pseudomonas sp. SLFW]NBB10654.1 chorismate mutase [Pseudomonas sp. SLFW]